MKRVSSTFQRADPPVLSRGPVERACGVMSAFSLSARPLTSGARTEPRWLAAELAAGREVGFAIADEELIEGVSGVAGPVISEAGHPLAALGVVGPSLRLAGELERIGALARDLTARLRPRSR